MKITYKNTIDDYLTWHLYQLEQSTIFQKQLKLIRILSSVMFFSIFALIGLLYQNFIITVVGGAFIGFYYYNFPRRIKAKHTLSLRKDYRKPENAHLLEDQKLEITPGYLLKTANQEEKKIPWDTVKDIIQTEDHTFVISGSNQVCILPKNALAAGDYSKFIEALKAHTQQVLKS